MTEKVDLEAGIRELTRPLNGQFPRPWVTDSTDPGSARVFIIGKNQAKGYPVAMLEQERHLDALFNRNGETCRGLYREVTDGKPSPTRLNIEALCSKLKDHGVHDVLETNVICYSTGMSTHLSRRVHQGGRQRGDEIFQFILATIEPSILIVHGESARELLGKALNASLPPPPMNRAESVVKTQLTERRYNPTIYVLQSLAPPAFNKWGSWAPEYFGRLAFDVVKELSDRGGSASRPSVDEIVVTSEKREPER